MMDLKAVLMELGNRLVMKHGFEPGTPGFVEADQRVRSTSHVIALTEFLNRSPEARIELRDLGLEWSMPEGQR